MVQEILGHELKFSVEVARLEDIATQLEDMLCVPMTGA